MERLITLVLVFLVLAWGGMEPQLNAGKDASCNSGGTAQGKALCRYTLSCYSINERLECPDGVNCTCVPCEDSPLDRQLDPTVVRLQKPKIQAP